MKWKSIGQNVIGSSHNLSGQPCQDAIEYGCISGLEIGDVLICCVSDGAGSAKYAFEASSLATCEAYLFLEDCVKANKCITEAVLVEMGERVYDVLSNKSTEQSVLIDEFSCTLLGAVLYSNKGAFFQIGDGAIVRDDGEGSFVCIWPPTNGEYQNTTAFLIDDQTLSNFKCCIIDDTISEIALFTDGLQNLTLNIETNTVHQPFFNDMFKWLRMADNEEKIGILNSKLKNYLNSDIINMRTDDDKTLFLSTRLGNDRADI
jgi:hypothetical protein